MTRIDETVLNGRVSGNCDSPIIPMAPDREGPVSVFVKSLLSNPKSISSLAWLNSGGHHGQTDSREAHAAEIGGAGGSIGFADADENMAFSYTMNKMGLGILLNERGQSLVDAAYQALGYTTNAPGVWMK